MDDLKHEYRCIYSIICSSCLSTYHTVGWLKDTVGKQTHKGIGMHTQTQSTQRVNKHIPGIKGHVSGESVCSCFAKEEAYAPVEAVTVCAGGRGGRGGGQRALLQQGQGVGRAVTQRVGAAAQLLATVRVHAVDQAIWKGQEFRNVSNETVKHKMHTYCFMRGVGSWEGTWIYTVNIRWTLTSL